MKKTDPAPPAQNSRAPERLAYPAKRSQRRGALPSPLTGKDRTSAALQRANFGIFGRNTASSPIAGRKAQTL